MTRFFNAVADLLLIVGLTLIGWGCFEIHKVVGLLYSGALCLCISFAMAKLNAANKEVTHDR